MSKEAVFKDLVTLAPEDFVSEHLFDKCPILFSERKDFIAWKNHISRHIEVDAASITIIGSSAIGMSLNPNKNFKVFDHRSDIDVAVISNYHFQVAWRFLRNNKHVRFRLSARQKAAWDEHVNRLIFWGTIATDKLLSLMPFAEPWTRASDEASRNIAVADREVKFRIYADYESLRSYQVNSVRTSREVALSKQAENA